MIAAAVRNPVLTAVCTLVVCVLGVVAATRVPVQMIPDLEIRRITVQTRWPGATPQDIEHEILIEQEQYLRSIPGLSRMVSLAATGAAWIELEFPFGTDIDRALLDVSNALAQVPDYPENVDPPSLRASSFSQNAFMFLRVEPADGNPLQLDMDAVQQFVEDHVRPRLERVPGISEVGVGGAAPRQIRITVDPARMARHGLGPWHVRDALRAWNRDRSGGDVDDGALRYLVRTPMRARDITELSEVPVALRGDSIIRLADVARVELGSGEPRSRSFTDGEPAIGLSVRRRPGSNVIAIKRAMLPEIDALNRQVLEPVGLRLRLLTDDVRYVEDSVRNVWTNLVLGALLATAVMYGFLRRGWLTVIGVGGIPVCTLAAFTGLLLAGRTINVISLAGVAFAIGMTLDNSIVVLEAIERHRRRGRDGIDAAIAGTREVATAVLASTLTTVLVFTPILFIHQEAGQLYSDVAIAISASILASMLVALTLVPAAAARLLGCGELPTPGAGGARTEALVHALIATPGRRLACILLVPLLAAFAILRLTPPAEYLPEGEEPKAFARMIAPPGYNLPQMLRIAEPLQRELLTHLRVLPETYLRGQTDMPPLAYLNLYVEPGSVRIIAETVDPAHIEAMMRALTRRFEQIPGMRAFVSRGSIITSNDGGTRSVNVEISGSELEALFTAAQALYARAREVLPGAQIGSAPSSLRMTQPMLRVLPDPDRLLRAGIAPADFAFAVAAWADGAWIDDHVHDNRKIDVWLYGPAGFRQNLAGLADAPVVAGDGTPVPLSALARLERTQDTDQIRRVDGQRTVTLHIIPPRSVALETAVGIVQREIVDAARAASEIPRGVMLDISGAADQLDATREALAGNFSVAVLLCYLLMVAIFRNFALPLVILATVPLGVAGGIGGLALLNRFVAQPFDLISMLGFLVLLGTVVNNPILVVDRAVRELRNGADATRAVARALRVRLRPVLMSTLTTLVGLSPLVFLPGAGTELYRGVGAIVLFGLLSAMLVTLVFLPPLLTVALQLGAGARRDSTIPAAGR